MRHDSLQHIIHTPIRRRRLLLAAGGAVLAGSLLPVSTLAKAAPAACENPPHEPLPFGQPDPSIAWVANDQASVVRITRGADGFQYESGGQPTIIRGMGYNPRVDGMSVPERQSRLDRDFAMMQSSGVNTLIGWNPAVFDGLALDVAQAHDLGVALPFDVDFTADYRDRAVRQRFRDAVLSWVEQYRRHPALRLWAIGNEVLQRSVPPAWCAAPPTPEASARAEAWASLLVETADLVHEHDPDHPVMYRDAEDAYAGWLMRALAARPADRPWLIYGTNAYTSRLPEILDAWASQSIALPLLVSEFAPLDAPRGQRADLLRQQWAIIREPRPYVLGGAVYVWSTDGPEEVDRAFGLVDERGRPVDDALEAVAGLYLADSAASSTTEAVT